MACCCQASYVNNCLCTLREESLSVKQQLAKTTRCGGHGRVSHQTSISNSILASHISKESVSLSPAFMVHESMIIVLCSRWNGGSICHAAAVKQRGARRNGSRYTQTLASVKCIAVPLGWWFTSWEIFSAGSTGSTMPLQTKTIKVSLSTSLWIYKLLYSWSWTGMKWANYYYFLHHCISPKLYSMFQVHCRFDQTCH